MSNEKSSSVIDVCVLWGTVNQVGGGGNQFLRTLASELSNLGHRVTNYPTEKTQLVLVNGFNHRLGRYLHPQQVAQLRQTGRMSLPGRFIPSRLHLVRARKGPVLIHRVDGVAELVRGHRTRADEIQPAVNRLTDHTIFQTEYCRTSFAEHSGVSPPSWRIITNAVDPRVFYPVTKMAQGDGPLRLAAASWSPNPRKGFADLAGMSRLPGVKVTFAGNWCPDIDPANVKLAGVLKSEDLADLMRSCDAMIHAAWNEPCSNAIVEAMACGLPVIYRDSGGSRELAGEYGVPLTEDPAETLEHLQGLYGTLRDKVLQCRDQFLIGRAAQEYLSMFRYAIEKHEIGRRD